ncbi:MAG: hypothetical protein EZS28_018160 [Streblomastix strix]|uniref:Uncharacterized protein n=1 Tax=Streblomastix strix TaxID=222440 RepID=A0A5J4VVD9_9EUKA|nr:MAG: hypothetical protein EZS28_018160 [Streblomastix strix]
MTSQISRLDSEQELNWIEKIVEEVNCNWRSKRIDDIDHGISMLTGNKAFWGDYKSKNCETSKILADLAERFIATPASEASCEWAFSKMKFIV